MKEIVLGKRKNGMFMLLLTIALYVAAILFLIGFAAFPYAATMPLMILSIAILCLGGSCSPV